MKRLLIRADDLGFSEGVNCGIAKAVSCGLVHSVGVMTNVAAVEHGLELLEGYDICFGQHTNICTGMPLTDPKYIPSICQENGEFKSSRDYRSAAKRGEDFVVLDEVILEIEAQYQRFRELVGREPEYFEGHAVASGNFFKGLEIVAQRHNLPYLAMKMDGPVLFRNTSVYSFMPKDFAAYEADPFTGVMDAVKNAHEDACDMMVFHPGYIDNYLLTHSSMTTPRVKEAEMLCRPEVKSWLLRQDIELVTFRDLR